MPFFIPQFLSFYKNRYGRTRRGGVMLWSLGPFFCQNRNKSWMYGSLFPTGRVVFVLRPCNFLRIVAFLLLHSSHLKTKTEITLGRVPSGFLFLRRGKPANVCSGVRDRRDVMFCSPQQLTGSDRLVLFLFSTLHGGTFDGWEDKCESKSQQLVKFVRTEPPTSPPLFSVFTARQPLASYIDDTHVWFRKPTQCVPVWVFSTTLDTFSPPRNLF